MPSKREVEASFEAVPAYIVADKRDKFGRRIGLAAVVLLVMFFSINGYIQSARNGAQLDEARKQRASVIESQKTIAETLQGQGLLIVKLQEIITRQNDALRKAGLPVEPVPNLQQLIDQATRASADPDRPRREASSPARSSPQPRHTTSPKPNPRPKPSPKPRPKPSPSPTRNPVTQTVCDATGICLPR